MSSYHLKVTRRDTTGKEAAKQLRATGEVPGVIYGHKEEPVKVAVNARDLRDMLAHGGHRGLIVLEEADGVNETAILKSVARHPAKSYAYSVDFQRVSRNESIHMTVPILLTGESDGTRVEGGVLVQALHELEIAARPVDIPEHIEVDISHLEFNGAPILVSEIKLPQGVTAVSDGEKPVAVINPPRVEEETEPLTAEEADAEADPSQVESEHGAATTGGEAGDDSRSGTNDGKD